MSTKELTRLLSDLGKLSAPLGRPRLASSTERLLATNPSSESLREALDLLGTAYVAFPSKTLLARGLAIAARVPAAASDLDLLARIAATAEPMLATVGRTRPRAFEKSPTLLAAISGSVLVSAALDRVGTSDGGGLDFLRAMIRTFDGVGGESIGFGLGFSDVFSDSRGVALRVLLDTAVAILAGRELDADDPDRNGGGGGGAPPLDDRLEPRPWGYPRAVSERAVADLVETVVDADGDCWQRARGNLTAYAVKRGLISHTTGGTVFGDLINATSLYLKVELTALRDATLGGPPASSPLPQLRSSAKPTSARPARCNDCECEACPMAGRTR